MIKPAVRPTDLTVFREVGGGARPSVSTSIMMVARRANPSSCPSNRSLFKGVQAALAAAMRAIPDQDPRDTVFDDCSALKHFVIDYGALRQRIRAALEKHWRSRRPGSAISRSGCPVKVRRNGSSEGAIKFGWFAMDRLLPDADKK